MEGNLIKWQNWHIRIGFTWREGLVIYNVNYEDEGRLRPILFRASIAEMAVPYAEAQVCSYHGWVALCPSKLAWCLCAERLPCPVAQVMLFGSMIYNDRDECILLKCANATGHLLGLLSLS